MPDRKDSRPQKSSPPARKKPSPARPRGGQRKKTVWETKVDEYDRRNFYVAASDDKGHSMVVRLPPRVAGEVAAIVASKDWPTYQVSADFYRDAVVHRLYDLAEMTEDKELKERLTYLVNLCVIESDIAAAERELTRLGEMEKNIEELIALAPTKRYLRSMLGPIRIQTEHVPEPFRTRIRRKVDEALEGWTGER